MSCTIARAISLKTIAAAIISASTLIYNVPLASADESSAPSENPAWLAEPRPFNNTVQKDLIPNLKTIINQLLEEKRAMTLDGVRVFEAQDKFLPGKIAIGMAHIIIDGNPDDAERVRLLKGFRELADLTIDDTNDTWGMYYYMSALNSLRKEGLLDEAVSPETLSKLREKLDWRTFVREDELTLIDLPNNYFGVAFSIARLRYLMGWEDESGSDKLLAKSLAHYREYSGEYGFADETPGAGRFDRYSVLLIGEFAQRFIETGIEPPQEVRDWLRKSVNLMMLRINPRGEGFEYGRSLGPYSETAFLEVFSAAAALDILTPQEREIAYSFSARIAERYQDVWFDEQMGSVNLWDKGRRTDAYRGKHRILGENLSLSHQQIYTNKIWNQLGYKGKTPDADIAGYRAALSPSKLTRFHTGDYERAVVTVRDGDRVIGLPIINGSGGQHDHNPYFPVPFSPGMLEGSADADYPQLTPRLTLTDGSILMPLAWFQGIRHSTDGDITYVDYYQQEMNLMGETAPRRDARLAVSTRYTFSPGQISRSDTYIVRGEAEIAKIEMEFASLSGEAVQNGTVTRYADGGVKLFSVSGLQECDVKSNGIGEEYRVSAEPVKSLVICKSENPGAGDQFSISWIMQYNPER